MVKRRSPISALLLSIVPGLGQIYNGQPRKGLFLLALEFLIPILFRLTGILNNLRGLTILLAFSLAFIFYRMIDGFIQAKQLKDYELKSYNKWYVYVSFAIAVFIIRTFLDIPTSTGIQTFLIPTPSMNPTMHTGDKIVVGLNYYDKNQIEQGDIVAFNSPRGGIWIFRVVGLPNDTIELKDGKVYVDDKLCELKSSEEYIDDGKNVIQYEELLNENKTIKTLRFKNDFTSDTRTFDKITVPDNEYFLMGDNRDNAYDSRFIGTIKKQDIIGRILYSYWGKTSDRINVDFRKK